MLRSSAILRIQWSGFSPMPISPGNAAQAPLNLPCGGQGSLRLVTIRWQRKRPARDLPARPRPGGPDSGHHPLAAKTTCKSSTRSAAARGAPLPSPSAGSKYDLQELPPLGRGQGGPDSGHHPLAANTTCKSSTRSAAARGPRLRSPSAGSEYDLQELHPLGRGHRPRPGVIHELNRQQLRADVPAGVEHVPVDERLASRLANVELVEKQVAQPIMDEGPVAGSGGPVAGSGSPDAVDIPGDELEDLRLVSLAPADDDRPGLRSLGEIAH